MWGGVGPGLYPLLVFYDLLCYTVKWNNIIILPLPPVADAGVKIYTYKRDTFVTS